MNLISVIITLCIALTSGLYYLKHNQDEPRAVQYRAVMASVEQVATKLGGDLRFSSMDSIANGSLGITQQCQKHPLYPQNLYIPANIKWRIEVLGLDCDIAKLSISVESDEFSLLARAAVESGVTLGEIDSTMGKIHWVHRLHKRRASDTGLKSALQTNYSDLCLRCISESSTIKIQQGDGQTAIVGHTLAQNPMVKVFVNDEHQIGIPNTTVTFSTSGQSQVTPVSIKTDSEGLASTQWTLGNKAGKYSLTASASDFSFSYVVFEATATPDRPESMIKDNWNEGQSGTAGEPFKKRPAIKVLDKYANPVLNEEITFRINQGDGTLGDNNNQTKTIFTNSDGIASISWTLGSQVGVNKVLASHDLLGDLSFSVNGLAGAPAQLELATQPVANLISGQIMTTQPVVFIKDRFGNLTDKSSSSITVSVEGDYLSHKGFLKSELSAIAKNGLASFRDLAFEGLINTDYRLKFTSPGLLSVTSDPIRVIHAGEPFKLEKVGFQSNAEVNSELDITVILTDRPGNRIPEREIAFEVVAGGGSVTTPIRTNSEGVATANWRLGTKVGTNTLIATINQLSETLQAETFSASPADLVFLRQPSAGNSASGEALDIQPILRIRDRFGNTIYDDSYWIGAGVANNNGETKIVGGYQAQNINGSVVFNGLAVRSIVDREFRFSFIVQNVDGVNTFSDPLSVYHAGPAYQMKLVQGDDNYGGINQIITPNPIVKVLDDMNNPVSGEVIEFDPYGVWIATMDSHFTRSKKTVQTDSYGNAEIRWKITHSGGPQQLTAKCLSCSVSRRVIFTPSGRVK